MLNMALGQKYKYGAHKSFRRKQITAMKLNVVDKTKPMANGLSHRSQGQRPWNANRNQSFGQRPYSMHHAPGGLNMAVGQKCVLGFITRGVALDYVEYGPWPTCGHALSENRRLTTPYQISMLRSLRSPQDT
jgi:hypothetical protein